MKRRTFMGGAAMGSLAGFPFFDVAGKTDSTEALGKFPKLAGMPLDQLRARYHQDLFTDFLPLMDHYVIDRRLGGFQCELNEDGTHPDDTKNIVFQGRGIWVYSFLYNHFGKSPGHLEVARQAVELIMKSAPSGKDEMWPAKISREGQPLGLRSATIGGDISIAEGLGEYSKATGENQYWDMAKKIVLKCVRAYGRPDYSPDVVAQYGGPPPIKFPGARTQGAAMILIGAVNSMLEMRQDAELEAIMGDCVRAIMEKHFNPEFRLNNELLNHDYSRPDNDLAQFVYPGHCIETFALLLLEALRNKNRALFQTAAERFRRHAEVALDEVYGGAFRCLNNVDANQWVLNKALWVQEELLNACLFVIETTGAEWAWQLYGKIYDHVHSRYYLKRWGYTFWISGGDRKVTVQPNLTRVEHYHHPRHLMYALLGLDRMIRRGGRAVMLAS
ncbi:MAG: AGE family epimerase/isomerase [Terriglobia bacterium]